jgi:hypothetical protein
MEEVVSQLDVTSSLYKIKLDKVKLYLQLKQLPEHLGHQVLQYYDRLWVRQCGVNGRELFHMVSETHRCEFAMQLAGHHIRKLFFFKDLNKGYGYRLAGLLALEFYFPGDFVFAKDEIVSTLFILYRGQVDLISGAPGDDFAEALNSANHETFHNDNSTINTNSNNAAHEQKLRLKGDGVVENEAVTEAQRRMRQSPLGDSFSADSVRERSIVFTTLSDGKSRVCQDFVLPEALFSEP